MTRSNPRVRNPDYVHPLPELSVENVTTFILGASFRNGINDNDHSVFGAFPLHTAAGVEVCAFLIAHAAATFGLEDPNLAELKAAARNYLEKVSGPRLTQVA